MAKININDLKNGQAILIDQGLFLTLDNQFVKPGKGAAFVRTKLRNLRTGSVIEKTFSSDIKVEQAYINKSKMKYLYNDGVDYFFMNNESYEQISIPKDRLGDSLKWLLEEMEVDIMSYENEILTIDLPKKVELRIIETEPGIKGDTASGGSKTAVTETGVTIIVPLFIKVDDIVIVNTETGEYSSRKN